MVPSTLIETGVCVCVCVCVRACVCMCGGGEGRLEFCCFLESGVLSLPPGKVTLRGVRRLISRKAAL